MPKLDNDKFIEGQNAFARGTGLRTIIETANTLPDDDDDEEDGRAFSLIAGYFDGIVASIRRIDNLLLFPKGPDG